MERPTFDSLGLSDDILNALDAMGWEHPTPVQEACIPLVLQGLDVCVQAQTGTGKTGAFGLPMMELVKEPSKPFQGLVLCPTRELARQVAKEMDQYGKGLGIACAVVYGGVGYEQQLQEMRSRPFVVGTPGRVLDHVRRGTLKLGNITQFILDECDEMLSMGFLEDILEVTKRLPPANERQTMLFSATVTSEIRHIAKGMLNDPEFVDLSSDQVAALSVKHVYYPVSGAEPLDDLVRMIEQENPESGIIFCNTRVHVAMVAGFLTKMGYDSGPISGDLPQNERERIMAQMKAGKLRFLVATDVASRGIDISALSHVLNFELPQSAQVYIHRTGRTGRAGKQGTAISLVGPKDTGVFYHLKLIYKFDMEERFLPEIDKQEIERTRLAKAYACELEREEKLKALQESGGGGGGGYGGGERESRDRDSGGRDRDRGRGRDRDRGGRDRDRDRDRGPRSESSGPSDEGARVYLSVGLNGFLDGPDDAKAALAELAGVDAAVILAIDLHQQYAFCNVDPEHADALIEGLQGAEVRGKALKAERAKSKGRRRRD